VIAFLQVNVGYSLHDFQALKLDAKTVKKRQVEFIDIAMDPVENYVESEDPMKFKSQKTGRGPLEEGWQVRSSYFISIVFQQDEHYVIFEPTSFWGHNLIDMWCLQLSCEPVMCAYKCVTVDVPYWGFGSRLEKFISKVVSFSLSTHLIPYIFYFCVQVTCV
jgi:hypothetical protein